MWGRRGVDRVSGGGVVVGGRDKVREQKAMLAQQKRVERDLAAKDEAAKSNDRRGLVRPRPEPHTHTHSHTHTHPSPACPSLCAMHRQ
eukprot:929614-Rhodomonas_salina.2